MAWRQIDTGQSRIVISYSPTLVFLLLLTLPAAASALATGSPAAGGYLVFAAAVSAVLLLADYLGSRIEKHGEFCDGEPLQISAAVYWCLIAAIAISLGVNILVHGTLPVLELLGDADKAEIRANHAKGSRLYYYLSYAINYCNYVFIPFLFFYLLEARKTRTLLLLLPVFLCSYTFFLSKYPPVFFLLFVVGLYFAFRLRIRFFRWLVAGMVVATLVSSHKYLQLIDTGPGFDSDRVYSIADVYRMNEQQGLTALVDDKIYRVMWVPSDVSALWFLYFREHRDSSGKGYRLNYPNIVAREYYLPRFPARFTVNAYAFASFDVDALVRFGWLGLGITLAGWACLRLLIAKTAAVTGSRLVHGYLLIASAVLLTAGSLQSLVLSNGFWLALLAIFLFADKNRVDFGRARERLRIGWQSGSES